MPTEPAVAALRLELFVRDLARSQRFYSNVLGFTPEPTVTPSSDYLPLVCGPVRLGLSAIAGLSPDHHFQPILDARPGVGLEIVLEVADLDACEQRARAMDAIVEPLQQRPWGLRDFRVLDPDGYYLRVTNRPVAPASSPAMA